MEQIEQIRDPLVSKLTAALVNIKNIADSDESKSRSLDWQLIEAVVRIRNLTCGGGDPNLHYQSAGVTPEEDQKNIIHWANKEGWEQGTNSAFNKAVAMFLYHSYSFLWEFETEKHLNEIVRYFFDIITHAPLDSEKQKNLFRVELTSDIQKYYKNKGLIDGNPVNPDRLYFEISLYDLSEWHNKNGGRPQDSIKYDDWMKYKQKAIKNIIQPDSSDNFMNNAGSNFIAEIFFRIEDFIKKESA